MLEQLVEDLKVEEGWRSEPYQDHLGFWTVGFGFLVDVRKPWRLPKQVGEIWLRFEAERRYEGLLDRLPWLMDQPDDVKRALTNMAYQLGVNGVLGFRRMLAALELGDRRGAAEEALDSKWHRQTPERAQRVAALIRGGNDG